MSSGNPNLAELSLFIFSLMGRTVHQGEIEDKQFVYVTTLFFLFVLISYISLLFLLFSFEVKVFVSITPSGPGRRGSPQGVEHLKLSLATTSCVSAQVRHHNVV